MISAVAAPRSCCESNCSPWASWFLRFGVIRVVGVSFFFGIVSHLGGRDAHFLIESAPYAARQRRGDLLAYGSERCSESRFDFGKGNTPRGFTVAVGVDTSRARQYSVLFPASRDVLPDDAR